MLICEPRLVFQSNKVTWAIITTWKLPLCNVKRWRRHKKSESVSKSFKILSLFNLVTGKKVGELSNDKLPGHCVDISVKGSQLAMAGWDDKNVVLFDLVTDWQVLILSGFPVRNDYSQITKIQRKHPNISQQYNQTHGSSNVMCVLNHKFVWIIYGNCFLFVQTELWHLILWIILEHQR